MSNSLLYYSNLSFLHNSSTLRDQIPGGENFLKIIKCFQPNVGIVDRTNTLTIPFKHKIKDPLPAFDRAFAYSYKECAMQRMAELDQLHLTTGKKFRLLYSGGIDSTAIFASFVEYYGLDKTSQILEICCSKDSIDENPWVWDRHIRKGNFKLKTSHDHTNGWNDDKIILMGEGNDQLFINIVYSKYKRNIDLYEPITPERVAEFLGKGVVSEDSLYCAEILMKLIPAATIPVENMSMFAWWYYFNLNWNAVGHRVLSQSSLHKLPKTFLDDSFKQFYQTNNFQKWCLKYHYDNPESFASIKDFKLECKQLSIDVLNIPEYSVKHKVGSFPIVHSMRRAGCLIDDNFEISHNPADFLKFIEPKNSFINN